MDSTLVGIVRAVATSIPGTAANRAEAAQRAAEAAAETAQHYGFGVYVEGHKLRIVSEEDDS